MPSDFTPSIAQVVRTFSISAQTMLREKYPELLSVLARSPRPSNDWDFFMTAAGVGYAIIVTNASGEEKAAILRQAAEIDSQLPAAISNLFDFVEKQKSAEAGLRANLGVWVLWNIGGGCPEHREMEKLAPAIGMYLEILVTKFLNEGKGKR
ncbi:MAG: hypothetical protein FD154_2299 [Elusimicrobia bacterium]|nr:MAG: hypothetical protein FD154_2299 [Elusimicrobiota bacterium]